jgi:MerR family transcriptional regulator/heat shock protein HspR
MPPRRTTVRTAGSSAPHGDGDRNRGVYMISVAASLAGMHPQTLRIYEARGLISPKRSPKQTRLYSIEDVQRLRRIQELTSELGMNLAGVEKVFELEGELDRRVRELERELERTRRRAQALELRAERLQQELAEEVERVRRSYRRELVPYEPQGQALVPVARRGGGGGASRRGA